MNSIIIVLLLQQNDTGQNIKTTTVREKPEFTYKESTLTKATFSVYHPLQSNVFFLPSHLHTPLVCLMWSHVQTQSYGLHHLKQHPKRLQDLSFFPGYKEG